MNLTDRRLRLRKQFAGTTCINPASVFDAISGRLADALGYELGILGGSVASAVVLGAPDVAVITLSELAEQVRRITRVSDISLIVDADHGYGNALSVMRTVEELEATGVSGLTIEDTSLPAAYGNPNEETLIPLDEMLAKLRSAVAARQSPETVIIARTGALRIVGMDETLQRLRAFKDVGVDVALPVGVKTPDQLQEVQGATSLPLMVGNTPDELTDELLAAHGVRVVLRGHYTLQAAVKGIQDVLQHQADGNGSEAYKEILASSALMGVATGAEDFKRWEQDFLA
jgi:carboxyvinyl-carboxyphosphonate phosphorylmutase